LEFLQTLHNIEQSLPVSSASVTTLNISKSSFLRHDATAALYFGHQNKGRAMSTTYPRLALITGLLLAASALGTTAVAPTRTVLKQADLSPSNSMEVVSAIVEIPPGAQMRRHLHHGIESGYVLQGAMIQRPGSAPERMETGTPFLNLRDVPHGGYKEVGDTPLRVFTVHVVDKGQPLFEYVD
jgi:quercetin dioxygenase-like cupin family protein